jgi:RNA polymerase sigma-70 factor (ECF subfamily)
MGDRFATTQWSIVLAARDGTESEARRALESLCVSYWYPTYAFVRGRGHRPEEARDLTQSFFADLLERDVMKSVDRDKGRFRSFLLACLGNFLSHDRDRNRTLKRGAGFEFVSLDAAMDTKTAEARFQREPVDELTPEQIFERRWGLTVMERAMRRLGEESVEAGKEAHFLRLRQYLTGDGDHGSYRAAAAELGISEAAIKNAVRRMRQRYGTLLRREVGETVAHDELDDELRHLLAVIRPWQRA